MIDIKENFHIIALKRKTYFDTLIQDSDLNMMEIEILYFLHAYPSSNTFTKIQESRDYAKSHVSMAISNLVKKQYIKKEYAPNNKKIFHLFLQDKSNWIIEEFDKCKNTFYKDVFTGIKKEHQEIFIQVIETMTSNLQRKQEVE